MQILSEVDWSAPTCPVAARFRVLGTRDITRSNEVVAAVAWREVKKSQAHLRTVQESCVGP